MKHKHFVVLFIAILTVCQACKKDFLTTPNRLILLRQSYISDLATSAEYMRGIYLTFAQSFYHGIAAAYSELAADNLKTAANFTVLTPHYQWSQTADNYNGTLTNSELTNLNPVWTVGYRIIHNCNYLIENIDKYAGEDPIEASSIKSQALSMRALAHFLLVNTFAQPYEFTRDASHPGVPYIETSRWDEQASRQTVKVCYDKMISDLTKAIAIHPKESKINTLTLNVEATKALLARIYLFKSDYEQAKNLSLEVIRTTPLMPAGLNGYPSALFTTRETEALFQLAPASTGSGESVTTLFQGNYYSRANLLCTSDLVKILTENTNDVRRSWVHQGLNGKDTVTKYPTNVIANSSSPRASYYQTMLRSSELYLTCAESYAHLGGTQDDSARYYLDAIRTRANATALSSTATGAALLDSIHQERRKELCFEGLRLFDLQRWKKTIIRQNEANPAFRELGYPNNRRIAPIPQPDVLIAGLQQNEGY